ncbi:DUF2894 domain-containing protein [Aromatoleum toluolicum]|uniref:DUF2894 domain-containing protein n=1 Tax=Aromatoleum toluolicum TaxID=90060 RepID=A0ABX1NLN1_9RHOO|nr:DUF2894 domain-containing protein [Aromatoleum toluolicum]NMG00268.1 DUF2894 domain-containing protein [Aromatoleum toluolicum]
MADAGLAGADIAARIEALRAQSAERFDPVGFRFIEALARRAAASGEATRGVLERRLAKALSDCRERLDAAGRVAGDAVADGITRFPESADTLRQCREAGDLAALQRLLARLAGQGGQSPLSGLLAHIGRHTPEAAASSSGHGGGAAFPAQPDLKSLSFFRSTWSRLSLDRQLTDAFAQAPENAGPLNSHHLVLQALGQMRDISPEYLRQFMSYVDALLWLDQADSSRIPARNNTVRKNPVRGEREKKRR